MAKTKVKAPTKKLSQAKVTRKIDHQSFHMVFQGGPLNGKELTMPRARLMTRRFEILISESPREVAKYAWHLGPVYRALLEGADPEKFRLAAIYVPPE